MSFAVSSVTGLPRLEAYAVDERWDLAFYVLTLSRPSEIAPRYMFPELKPYPLDELAIRSDNEATRGAVGSLSPARLPARRGALRRSLGRPRPLLLPSRLRLAHATR